MCEDSGTPAEAFTSTPREATGPAVDPITLAPVDEVTVTTLVDNSYDALMGDVGPARRFGMGRVPPVAAPQFEGGCASPGLIAEHGFSALVTTRSGNRTHTVLFDTGISPDGMATNFERLGLDASAIEAVVLGVGHPDHDGDFRGWLGCGVAAAAAGSAPAGLRQASVRAAGRAGNGTVDAATGRDRGRGIGSDERRRPSLLLDGSVLITGKVDRTTGRARDAAA